MSTVTRTAGVDGTFSYSLSVEPDEAPELTIYSDAARTVEAVAASTLVATASPSVFTASYPASLAAGTYYLRFSTVVTTGQPAVVDSDDQLVLTAVAGSVAVGDLLTIAEARAAVKKETTTAFDTLLASLVTAVSERFVALCGPVVTQTFTETHDGGGERIWLRQPALGPGVTWSVDSVSEWSGTSEQVLTEASLGTSDPNNWMVDHLGALTRISGGSPSRFAAGTRNVVVTYSVGRAADTSSVPKRFKEAAAITVSHLFTGRQGYQAHEVDFGGVALAPAWAVPKQALDLIQGDLLPPGVG